MTSRLAIGDFARSTHLSVKALRHYHDIGLLVPDEVDAFSGYRYYRPDQVPIAQVIHRLRDLDMPLDGVRAVVEAPTAEQRNAAIADHLARMEDQLAQTRATVADLRALLTRPADRLPVTMRSISSTAAAAVTDRITVPEFGAWWSDAFGLLHGRTDTTGAMGALLSVELFEQEEGEVTAFVPVREAPSGDGRVRPMTVPAVEAATVVHEGPLEELDVAYASLGVQLAERGGITLPVPIREYYTVSPLDTDDPAAVRTEICWPVFRTV